MTMSSFKRADLGRDRGGSLKSIRLNPGEQVEIDEWELDLDPETAAFMLKEVQGYLSPAKPTIQRIYENLHLAIHERNEACAEEDCLNVPSRATVCRAIQALDPFSVEAARNGEAAARKKFSPFKRVKPDD